MKEYMVYTNGDSFQINAEEFQWSGSHEAPGIGFYVDDQQVAAFNWNNIVGWEEKREDVK